MKSVSPILEESNGETPVYIYCENDKKSYLAPEKMWVENSDEIIIKLKNILGEENVKIVEK
jgi:DNA polymerase-3 subunit alpha